MITFKDVRNRERCKALHLREGVQTTAFLEKMSLKSNNLDYLKQFLESWRNIENKNSQSFKYLLETVDTYFSQNNNTGLTDVLYTIKNDIIPSLDNIKENRNLIIPFANKYDKSLIETMELYKDCDRILNNHRKLNISESKNFDNTLRNLYIHDSTLAIEDCVYELCTIIDSYKMPFRTKFSVALENILYGMDNINTEYNAKLVLQSIVDTFLGFDYQNSVADMGDILAKNELYTEDAKSTVAYLYNEDYSDVYLEGIKIQLPHNKDIIKKLNELKTKKLNPQQLKTEYKNLIAKMYAKSENNIIEDTPNILSWIRVVVVFSIAVTAMTTVTTAPGIIVGLAIILVDQFISMGYNREKTEKMVTKYKAEVAKMEKKVDTCKNTKTKEKYEVYLKELKDSLSKLEDYRDSLHTEKENDKRREDEYNFDESVEEQIPLDEETANNIINVVGMIECAGSIYNNPIEDLVTSYLPTMNMDDIGGLNNLLIDSNLVDYSTIIPIYKEAKKYALENVEGRDKYKITSALEDGICRMKYKESVEDIDYTNECYKLGYMVDSILEGNLKNNIRVAASRAKNTVISLNSKQKTISNTMDGFVDRFKDKVQREMTNKSREAVIKGTVLPSLSTMIKMCIASGAAAAMVHPLLGAITFIGGLAISKAATMKEKQYILDEIDIQLKVVDKKIQLAENNNDMDAMEQLLKIQQKLRQEKQRIIYNGQARNFRRERD